MTYTDHSHSDYADSRHDHDPDYAEKYHRHHDDESTAAGLREDLGRAESRISELEDGLNAAADRIARLEARLNPPAVEPEPTTLPAWDEMTDLDKGAALLHLHKREAEGADYAIENYAAKYFDHPALTALDDRAASEHAATLSVNADALPFDEYERLYDLALDADRKRFIQAMP